MSHAAWGGAGIDGQHNRCRCRRRASRFKRSVAGSRRRDQAKPHWHCLSRALQVPLLSASGRLQQSSHIGVAVPSSVALCMNPWIGIYIWEIESIVSKASDGLGCFEAMKTNLKVASCKLESKRIDMSGSGTHDGARKFGIAMVSGDVPCCVQINNLQHLSASSLQRQRMRFQQGWPRRFHQGRRTCRGRRGSSCSLIRHHGT